MNHPVHKLSSAQTDKPRVHLSANQSSGKHYISIKEQRHFSRFGIKYHHHHHHHFLYWEL